MGKYTALQDDIFSIFADAAWEAENIQTFPTDTIPDNNVGEFIRVNIVGDGQGLNLTSISGVVIIDIFVAAGNGPTKANLIADTLDSYLVGKSFRLTPPKNTQFLNSNMVYSGRDPDNPSLSNYSYSIPFKHFGVS